MFGLESLAGKLYPCALRRGTGWHLASRYLKSRSCSKESRIVSSWGMGFDSVMAGAIRH